MLRKKNFQYKINSFLFKGFFMFITNEMNYGHLIDPENFNISLTQPELYEVFNNIKVNHFVDLF